MNIGLVNVADRPFKEFLHEAMKTNYRIYDLKLGAVEPFVWRAAGSAGNRAPKRLQIPRALPGHKVDGVKTPWPGRPSERLDGSCLVAGAETGGTGADFQLCWDERNLYLYAEIVDSHPRPGTAAPAPTCGRVTASSFSPAANLPTVPARCSFPTVNC